MFDEKMFSARLSELRKQKCVSARDMSLSIGQCENYINKIENGKAMPSMAGFFYICDFLGVSPSEFFDCGNECPALSDELIREIRRLDYMETEHILNIVRDICRKK